jgi:uncharacterized protein
MVLVDIDTLSEAELRDIAQQLEVEDWEDLSREDLIEAIEDNYDDEDMPDRLSGGASSGHRYIKMMTKAEHEGGFGFPGVEELPEFYNETSICLLLKDFNWAYAFWNIGPNTLEELEQSQAELLIRVAVLNKNGEAEDSYEIGIDKEDSDWSVELPWSGRDYRAYLVARCGQKEEVLAQSNVICVRESWLASHIEVLENPARFNLLMSALVTKEGSVINNMQVRELFEKCKNLEA